MEGPKGGGSSTLLEMKGEVYLVPSKLVFGISHGRRFLAGVDLGQGMKKTQNLKDT